MRISLCRTTSLLLPVLTSTLLVHADVLYVDASAGGANDGSDWLNAFDDLQDAMMSALPGDEIWVHEGTYRPGAPGDVDASFILADGVAMYGGFVGEETARSQRKPDVYETILSGDVGADDVYGNPVWYNGWNINTPNSKHIVIVPGVGDSTLLDGFTLIGGYLTTGGGGAGMRITSGSPLIVGCTFMRNLTGFSSGGAVQVLGGDPRFIGCSFLQNYVHLGKGAAIDVQGAANVTVEGCGFQENILFGTSGGSQGAGGAINMYSTGALTIEGSDFGFNRASNFYPAGDSSGTYGGAIHHLFGNMTVDRCTFIGNSSNAGGAIWSWRDPTISNSLFYDNDAPEYSAAQGGWGGIGGSISGSSFQAMTMKIYGCTIVASSAHEGGGLNVGGSQDADVRHSIFWGNTDQFGSIGPAQIRGAGATNSCIQNMLVGEPGEDPPDPEDFPGCIDDDPLFVAAYGDLRLNLNSPCIDTGEANYVGTVGERDLDGHARILCGRVDMGAYEFGFGDFDCNGSVDLADYAFWSDCLTGPDAGPYADGCEALDATFDFDVDQADFHVLQAVLPGS